MITINKKEETTQKKLEALEAWVKVMKTEINFIIECSKEDPELTKASILSDIKQEIDRPVIRRG